MNTHEKLDSIVSRLIFLLASALLATYFGSCAPDGHAGFLANWIHLSDVDASLIETDGRRLYAGGTDGIYLSTDHGYTWRLRLNVQYCTTITIHQNTAYAGTYYEGVFRSDSYGVTWQPKNSGILLIDRGGVPGHPIIEQVLATSSGTVIAVGYHDGTFTSTDRGETWHGVIDDWIIPGDKDRKTSDFHVADGIWSMTEYNGYLWAAYSNSLAFRSPDSGETWESLPYWAHGSIAEYRRVVDWAVRDDQLYVAGDEGFGRWNEAELAWDDLSQGLPNEPSIQTLALNRGRIFAGLDRRGVWVFDERFETWFPVGLEGASIYALVSHQSNLYAATKNGIYRASISVVQPHGKAITTWGAIKQK